MNKLYSIGPLCLIMQILSLATLADARAYRKVGYKYDTLLNPIARVYYQHHRNTALRSIMPAEEQPVETNEATVLQKAPSRQRKFEIGVPNESFGLNPMYKHHDSDLHAFRVDLVGMPTTTTEQPTMRRTLKRILHRMRY